MELLVMTMKVEIYKILTFQIKFQVFNAHGSENITTICFMNGSSSCFTILKSPSVVLLNIIQIIFLEEIKSGFFHFSIGSTYYIGPCWKASCILS